MAKKRNYNPVRAKNHGQDGSEEKNPKNCSHGLNL